MDDIGILLVKEWIASLPALDWSEAKDISKCGVYLIYREDELLYVGESTNLGGRLLHHHSKDNGGNLAWHLMDDLSDVAGGDRVHHCACCGKFISCDEGDRRRITHHTVTKAFRGLTVRFGEFDRDSSERFRYEAGCREYLKPRYPRLKS